MDYGMDSYWVNTDAYYESKCYHVWKPILLLHTTVFNCQKCDAKKEEIEKIETPTKIIFNNNK
jgi:hypothetical protein